MSKLFVSSSKRLKFVVNLKVHELLNIPLVSGQVWVKWQIGELSGPDSRGQTDEVEIFEHSARWSYETSCEFRMTVDKSGNLQGPKLKLTVIQEREKKKAKDRLVLGKVIVDLAQYIVHSSEESIKHRFLLQKSKVNAALRLSIDVNQISGPMNYMAPPLDESNVLPELADIFQNDSKLRPSASSNFRSDNLDMRLAVLLGRDLYKQTLASRLSSVVGELDLVDLIEDIFQGGTGWNQETKCEERKRTSSASRSYAPSMKDISRYESSRISQKSFDPTASHGSYRRSREAYTRNNDDAQSNFQSYANLQKYDQVNLALLDKEIQITSRSWKLNSDQDNAIEETLSVLK